MGKSSFFNRVSGPSRGRGRQSRRRNPRSPLSSGRMEGHDFQVVDTGGFLSKDLDGLNGSVRKQIEVAVEEADLVHCS